MSEIERQSQKPKIKISLIIGLIIIILLVLFSGFRAAVWLVGYTHSGVHWSIYCAAHMSSLGKELLIYSNDHNDKYPPAEKWCDLLMQYDTDLKEEKFKCKGAGKGRCHYAMNPNCEPNSPEDVVLLFETKEGWNQFGGVEIITFENHKGKGCNVLFNNGRVKFVMPKEVGKMKWKGN